MASITIRNLDEGVKRRLRIRAAENGRSMEEEVREILRNVTAAKPSERGLGTAIRSRFAELGGVELELPPRELPREPPDFSDFPVSDLSKSVKTRSSPRKRGPR